IRAWAFFSPSLDPVLDRGKRDKDAVVAPEVPTRGSVGQAVFDHQPYRQIHHAVGVLTARGCQIGEVGAKVLATLRTVMLGIGHQQITRTPHVEIPQIVERPLRLLVPIGRVTTTWARLPEVVATVGDDLGLWQVCGGGDPGAWVGAVLTWTVHRVALLAQRCGPALYAKRLRGATRCSRYSLNNELQFPLPGGLLCQRLALLFQPGETLTQAGDPGLKLSLVDEALRITVDQPGHALASLADLVFDGGQRRAVGARRGLQATPVFYREPLRVGQQGTYFLPHGQVQQVSPHLRIVAETLAPKAVGVCPQTAVIGVGARFAFAGTGAQAFAIEGIATVLALEQALQQ